MNFIKIYDSETYNYKQIKRSLNLYHYCKEENILIGKNTYEKPYAIFLSSGKILRNITFDNKNYRWRVCFLTKEGVKFLEKNGLLKDYYLK